MIEAVAHCAVAILTIPSIEGSASATAAGVIAEFRAVVPMAAATMPTSHVWELSQSVTN